MAYLTSTVVSPPPNQTRSLTPAKANNERCARLLCVDDDGLEALCAMGVRMNGKMGKGVDKP
jgi:hypothetical protein